MVKLAYILGALAAATALYLLLNPYSVSTYYSGPVRPINITVNGVMFIYLNNTGNETAYIPAVVGESIYGVSVRGNVTLTAPPGGATVYNFTFAKYIYIMNSSKNVNILIQSVEIPLINKILTIIMVILFILMFAFLVVGYLFQITYKTGRIREGVKEK